MIDSKDRSMYFGASDTHYIVGNWNTKSFEKWWLEKIGINKNNFTNEAMITGTYFEHKILDSLEIEVEKDKQFIKDLLRVNLDGMSVDCIYEVKTYRLEKGFKVSKQYNHQVQVQMYITGLRNAYIVSYGLVEKDYKNFFSEIEPTRREMILIPYDESFIENEYLPKLEILTDCLKRGVFPCNLQE